MDPASAMPVAWGPNGPVASTVPVPVDPWDELDPWGGEQSSMSSSTQAALANAQKPEAMSASQAMATQVASGVSEMQTAPMVVGDPAMFGTMPGPCAWGAQTMPAPGLWPGAMAAVGMGQMPLPAGSVPVMAFFSACGGGWIYGFLSACDGDRLSGCISACDGATYGGYTFRTTTSSCASSWVACSCSVGLWSTGRSCSTSSWSTRWSCSTSRGSTSRTCSTSMATCSRARKSWLLVLGEWHYTSYHEYARTACGFECASPCFESRCARGAGSF